MKNGLSLSRNDACALGGRRGDPNKMYERHPYVGRASLILESVAWHLTSAGEITSKLRQLSRTNAPLAPIYASYCMLGRAFKVNSRPVTSHKDVNFTFRPAVVH